MEVIEALEYAERNKLTEKAAIEEKAFRDFVRNLDIKTAVEIGTYRGVTAAFIAQQAEKVYTFDLADYPEKSRVWQKTGTNEKIVFAKINTIQDIQAILIGVNYDFCFIDGPSDQDQLSALFEITKKAGRVLFHNAGKKDNYKTARAYVTTLPVIAIGSQSLYWEEK